MAAQDLKAEPRNEFGKGAARRIRREDKIPAVIYSNGTEPVHIVLPGHETLLAVRNTNALLDISVDGESHLALVKDIQRDPVRQIIEHVDLLAVKRGEKVTVDVTISIEGEPDDNNAYVNLDMNTVSIEAEATNIPEDFIANIEGREIGSHFYASELVMPEGVTLLTDPETLLVNISEPVVQDLGEEPETEGEEGEEGAEGEGAEGEDGESDGDSGDDE